MLAAFNVNLTRGHALVHQDKRIRIFTETNLADANSPALSAVANCRLYEKSLIA